ncbi:hypothetical protein [uncultured Shewanella sp.]|uniref:hypothetical protein n=1 Tax=uncultured Shewanella sp. TaxID=173975 RepID=UPI00260904A9|nr:hypothetical protein [uncultured Shewanella sp.]
MPVTPSSRSLSLLLKKRRILKKGFEESLNKMLAENEGDEKSPELTSIEVVFETERAAELSQFFDAKVH